MELIYLALEFKEIEYEYKAVHLVKGGGQQVLNLKITELSQCVQLNHC